MPDGPQLRLQLLSLSSLEWLPTKTMLPMQSQMAPLLAMGPLLDVPCSDYVFVLVDNVIRIFSLGSSTQVASLRPLGDALSPALDSLSVAGDGRHIAVGCSELQRFWLYSLTPPPPAVPIPGTLPRGVREDMLQVRAGSLRLGSVPLELRVREVEWSLEP